MAADYDLSAQASSRVQAGYRPMFTVENEIDFSEVNGGAGAGLGETVGAINVYKGWLVHRVLLEVVTPEGATQTFDVGDETDPNGFLDAVNGNAAAGTQYVTELALTDGTPNTVTGYSNGKIYAADDQIDVTATQACDTAVIKVVALVTDMNPQL